MTRAQIIDLLEFTEDNMELAVKAIQFADQTEKEVVMIDLFKTPHGDTFTINKENLGQSIIEVRIPGGVERFMLDEVRAYFDKEED